MRHRNQQLTQKKLLQLMSSGENVGILLRILSGVVFALMMVCVKALGDSVPLGEVIFFRSAFAMIPLIIFMKIQRNFPNGLKTTHPMRHFKRSIFGATAMFTLFAAIQFLPLAEATMLYYLSPLMLVILSAVYLGEQVPRVRWVGVGLGFCGVLVMTLPSMSGHTDKAALWGALLSLLTALLTAVALLQVKKLKQLNESTGAIAFYFALVSLLAGLLTLPLGWVMPSLKEIALLVGAGIAGGIAHIFMTMSFSYARASVLAPYEYLALPWAMLTGFIFFEELPGFWFFAAMPLVFGGVILSALKVSKK